MHGYIGNIEKATLENENFRAVLYTGPDSQLVVMSIQPQEEIGKEAHSIDQFIRVEAGRGEITIGERVEIVSDGFAVVVPANTMHNVVNVGEELLKLYTIYTAPQHKDGTVHKTKADAEADPDEH